MEKSKQLGINKMDFKLILGSAKIDYDPAKNEANKLKHGYSFDDAKDIFSKIVFPFGGKSVPFLTKDSISKNNEVRANILTVDKNGVVVLIALTMRPNETVRIISMRRASRIERSIFSKRYLGIINL
ncbi:MAG: BrnT family toxin [Elusimicrobia bacterium]|nr:BrnT family toxin [Elusimicrobiota bacterium]